MCLPVKMPPGSRVGSVLGRWTRGWGMLLPCPLAARRVPSLHTAAPPRREGKAGRRASSRAPGCPSNEEGVEAARRATAGQTPGPSAAPSSLRCYFVT